MNTISGLLGIGEPYVAAFTVGGVSFTFTFLSLWVLALTVPAALALTWFRRKYQPTIVNPSVQLQKSLRSFPVIGFLPTLFFAGFMLTMAAILARPALPELHETRTLVTRDISFAVDNSGSMGGTDIGPPPADGPRDKEKPYRRLDGAQDALAFFVPKREGDRVGLFIFDDATYMHWPLTDDLKVIMTKIGLIDKFTGGGTNFEGPTASDKRVGPIQAALNHWKEYGKAGTKVLILVTDGEAPISYERMEDFIRDYKAIGGKVYVLGIGPDWTKEGNPPGLEPIKKLVKETGGKAFAAGDIKQLEEAVASIDKLEKSTVKLETNTTYRDIYEKFAALAAILLVLFFCSIVVTRETA